jgi:hypothetical protein
MSGMLRRPDFTQLTDGIRVRLEGDDWTIAEVLRTVGPLAERVLIDLSGGADGEYLTLRGTPRSMQAVLAHLPVAPEDELRFRRKFADHIINLRHPSGARLDDHSHDPEPA